jgi:DNA mismatch repair protein MutS2
MDRALALPGLVLLDEIGAGTDPAEGGALGVAVIDHFRRRGSLVISTTHYEALKAYAAATDGVVCSACGFDPNTFAPTYTLTYGSPGRSLALEIAARLGLNADIVAAARRNLSTEQAQLADHLAKMDEDLHALEHERRLVRRERETLAEADQRSRVREVAQRQREETWKARLNEALDEQLRAARAQIDVVLADLRRRTADLAAQASRHAAAPISTGETGAARRGAQAAVEQVVERLRPAADELSATPAAPVGRPAAVGDRVSVGGFGLEGIVVLVHDREAEVDVRGKRLRSRLGDLRVLGGPAPRAPVRVSVQLQPHAVTTELNLVGTTVDEALARVEKFLDESLLSEQRVLRIIHGYGTGQLRRAVAEFLGNHPLVAGFQPALPNEGGGGVTVVELKD